MALGEVFGGAASKSLDSARQFFWAEGPLCLAVSAEPARWWVWRLDADLAAVGAVVLASNTSR